MSRKTLRFALLGLVAVALTLAFTVQGTTASSTGEEIHVLDRAGGSSDLGLSTDSGPMEFFSQDSALESCSGSCNCSTCVCTGTYSCCATGCGICFDLVGPC